MHETTRIRRRRSAGVLLAATGAFASLLGLARPAAAEPVEVVEAELRWSVMDQVHEASSLNENRLALEPATVDPADATWTFPQGSGTFDPATGELDIRFAGGLEFGNTNQGGYRIRILEPRIVVDADGEGRMTADVSTRPSLGQEYSTPVEDVVVLTFDADPSVDGPSASFTSSEPDYPVQAGNPEMNEWLPSFLEAIPNAMRAHFRGTTAANNVTKAPNPVTLSLTFEEPPAEEPTTVPEDSSTTDGGGGGEDGDTDPTVTPSSPTTESTSPTPTTPAPGVEPSGSATATGPAGQTLTVTPVHDLDPAGQTVQVTGSGYDPAVGIYVAFCVDNGPGAAPSPCIGGIDMSGQTHASRWITTTPPAPGLTTPFGDGGSFSTTLDLVADDGTTNCLAPGVQCVVSTRADHTRATDRSADVRVPVYFVGQTPPDDPEPTTPGPAVLSATTVAAGGSITVSAGGFLPGEQVQVVLHSEPKVLGVEIAGDDGTVTSTKVIPADTPAGSHHIELVGVTSGMKVQSPLFTVTAIGGAGAARAGGGSTTGAAGALARTGGEVSPLVLLGLVLITTGAALSRRARPTVAS